MDSAALARACRAAVGLFAAALLACETPPAGRQGSRGDDPSRGGGGDAGDVGATEPSEAAALPDGGPPAPRRAEKAWTVLMYMAADNDDLPPYAYWHIDEMEAAFPEATRSAASTVDADVLVQLDLLTPPGLRRFRVLPDARAYAPHRCRTPPGCTPADIASPILDLSLDESVPPDESLRRFLSWGVASYPARHYLVVIWGHGLGFLPARGRAGRPADEGPVDLGRLGGGVAYDESQGAVLDTPSLRAALGAVSREQLGGRPFDGVAFDACLMQSLEVATEIADVARFLVGSEQIEDYLGLPYRTLLPRLNGTARLPAAPAPCAPDDAACAVAALLPALTREAWSREGLYAVESPAARESFTLSAIDTARLTESLLPALGALSRALSAYMSEDDLRRIDLQILLGTTGASGDPRTLGTPSFLGGSRDVGVFLERLRAVVASAPPSAAVEDLLAAITGTRAALDRTMIAAAFGTRYPDPGQMAGASAWLPRDSYELQGRIDFFASSRFYTLVPAWPAFLTQLFAGP